MSTDNVTFEHPVPAAADLSAKKYYGLTIDSVGEAALISAITQIPIGILQNAPDAQGKPAGIASNGISKCVLGGTLSPGVPVGFSAAGKIVADAATNYTAGVLMKGGVDTEIGEVFLRNFTAKA